MSIKIISNRDLIPQIAPITRANPIIGGLVRMSAFHLAIDGNCLERRIINGCWRKNQDIGCCSPEGYDRMRYEKSQDLLRNLGVEKFSLIPVDQEAVLEGAFFSVQELHAKIRTLGGNWSKIEHAGSFYFAITPPLIINQEWSEFSNQVLKKMYWAPAEWDSNILITAKDVDNVPDIISHDKKTKCILVVDSTVPYTMGRRRVSAFLGMGLDVCRYNGRGMVGGVGYPSEAGAYSDVESVFQYLTKEKGFNPSEVCVTGSCIDTVIGMDLLGRHVQEGLNAYFEHPPTSISSIAELSSISKFVFDKGVKSLCAPENSQLHGKFIEDGFHFLDKVKRLEPNTSLTQGKVLLVGSEGDIAAPPKQVEKISDQLRAKIPRCTYAVSDTKEINDGFPVGNPHMAFPYRNDKIKKIFIKLFMETHTQSVWRIVQTKIMKSSNLYLSLATQ